jgi:serpin B
VLAPYTNPMLNLLLAVAASAAIPDTAPFAFDFYKELSAKPGNIFYSPFSLETALAMTSAGAHGPTLTEMQRALKLNADPHQGFHELGVALESADKDKPQLSIANRLWGKTGEHFEQPFLDLTAKLYGASLVSLDFAGDPNGARKEINSWVEKQTHDKIRDLVPDGAINKLTTLILTNAIYFKGNWKTPFKKDSTKPQPFHGDGGSTQHPFMHLNEKIPYWQNEDFQAIRLPYNGNELAMTVFLPNTGKTLASLSKQITPDLLRSFRMGEANRKVAVTFPKFRLEQTVDAKQVLERLGMKLAFTPKADFTGIRKPLADDPLFISAVLHKAFIEVDEAGTEAAAATAVVMAVGAAYHPPEQPRTFIADRPFFFVIEETQHNAVLFMGRVSKL